MVVGGCEECMVVELGDIYKSSAYGEDDFVVKLPSPQLGGSGGI